MRKTLILLLCITVSFCAFSQNKNAKQSLSIGIGPSFPLGDFGSKDLNDNGAGFAGIGQALNIDYFLPFSKNFGLIVSATGQRNPVNTKKLEESFNEFVFSPPMLFFGGGFTSPVVIPVIKYEHWNFEQATWWGGNVMAGIQMSSDPDHYGVNFYSRLQFGAQYVSMPEFQGKSETDTLIATYTQTTSHGIGFAYSFSAGMNYSLNNKTFLFANAGYTGTSKIKMEDINTTMVVAKNPGTIGGSISSSSRTGNGKQDFQTLNVTVGIGLRL